MPCGSFEHQRRVQFEGCGGAAPDNHGHLLWVERLAPAHCAARRFERSAEGVSAFVTEGPRGRHHSLHGGAKQGVARFCGAGAAVDKEGRWKRID